MQWYCQALTIVDAKQGTTFDNNDAALMWPAKAPLIHAYDSLWV